MSDSHRQSDFLMGEILVISMASPDLTRKLFQFRIYIIIAYNSCIYIYSIYIYILHALCIVSNPEKDAQSTVYHVSLVFITRILPIHRFSIFWGHRNCGIHRVFFHLFFFFPGYKRRFRHYINEGIKPYSSIFYYNSKGK